MRRFAGGARDRRFFRRTANKTKAINFIPSVGRGGIILQDAFMYPDLFLDLLFSQVQFDLLKLSLSKSDPSEENLY